MPDARANSIAQLSHLINGTLDLDEVFERTLEQACLLTGGERAAILLAQGEGTLHCQAAVGMPCSAWASKRFGFAHRLAEQVLAHQRARLTSDAQVDLRHDLARSMGIQSILCVPLLSSGHSIGVLYVERRLTQGVFTADDLDRLELIATYGAVAIENARRYGYALESARREGAASMAEALVLALLPQEAPQIPGYDIAARWQSARDISANFYDIFPLPEEHWGLVVADVSERGAPAAILMALTRSIIRGSVMTTPGPGPGIQQANRLLRSDFEEGHYVLAFYGELEPQGMLRYINA
ncbi:MAG: GAF domain-containing protein, partial [Ardenticatenales bacterium]|nr:GAF domain-containing protein [Ardenticatenales bacterium]